MIKQKTLQQVCDELAKQGLYEEANLDKDEIEKTKLLVIEDYECAKRLRLDSDPNYRVI